MNGHIIENKITLLEALRCINTLAPEPLVLFVLDEQKRLVGTLTDGDSRRALIAGASVNDTVDTIMHRDFNYMRVEDIDDVKEIRRQRELKMRLVPVLDNEKRIIEILDLENYKTRLPIDAVLMAGGKGERLRPLTEKTPKPLLKVGDKTIIDHNIDRLIDYGVKHISVTVNYLKEQIEDHFREPRRGVQVSTVREPQFLGTIGGIRFIPEFYNDTVLVMNSDLFTNINYEDFYLHFKDHDADLSVATVSYSIQIPYGIFQIENKRNICGLVEKPTYDYYVNAGIYLIKRKVLELIPEDSFFNATDLINTLIANNGKVIRFPLNGIWIDIGNPQEYKRANEVVSHVS